MGAFRYARFTIIQLNMSTMADGTQVKVHRYFIGDTTRSYSTFYPRATNVLSQILDSDGVDAIFLKGLNDGCGRVHQQGQQCSTCASVFTPPKEVHVSNLSRAIAGLATNTSSGGDIPEANTCTLNCVLQHMQEQSRQVEGRVVRQIFLVTDQAGHGFETTPDDYENGCVDPSKCSCRGNFVRMAQELSRFGSVHVLTTNRTLNSNPRYAVFAATMAALTHGTMFYLPDLTQEHATEEHSAAKDQLSLDRYIDMLNTVVGVYKASAEAGKVATFPDGAHLVTLNQILLTDFQQTHLPELVRETNTVELRRIVRSQKPIKWKSVEMCLGSQPRIVKEDDLVAQVREQVQKAHVENFLAAVRAKDEELAKWIESMEAAGTQGAGLFHVVTSTQRAASRYRSRGPAKRQRTTMHPMQRQLHDAFNATADRRAADEEVKVKAARENFKCPDFRADVVANAKKDHQKAMAPYTKEHAARVSDLVSKVSHLLCF